MVKVLIVDDSSFVRRSLTTVLERDKDITVVAAATNGEEGVEMARKYDPDVITMDVEMPKMDGLTALKKIMAETPCPVIMISSLTSEGAEVTLRALDLGALDYMPKMGSGPTADVGRADNELIAKVKALARRKAFMRLMFNRNKNTPARPAVKPLPPPLGSTCAGTISVPTRTGLTTARPASLAGNGIPGRCSFDAVAIGVSTGGPPAVQKVLAEFPADFPAPILIAQHMPAAFTGPFAKRLDAQCAISVKEAESIERLKSGTAYICPGGKHLRLENRSGTLTGVVTEEPKEALYKPSANVLMETVGLALGRRALCVMLTGMGNDGLEGTKILKEKGGRAIAQSENSCVVYGMPKAIVDAQLADEVVDLDDMARAILAHFGR